MCVQRILSKPVALQTSPHSRCVLCTWCNAQQSSTAIRFLFFHEIVMDLANIVFLCWPMEYTILKEVILLEVVYLCSVFCITGAPQKQIFKFLLCKVYLHTQTCSRWYSPPQHSHLLTSNRRNQINPKVGTFIENTEIIWFEKIIGFHWKVQ